MNRNDFRLCPYCSKLNPRDNKRCSWCYGAIPGKYYNAISWLFVIGAIAAIGATLWIVSATGGR